MKFCIPSDVSAFSAGGCQQAVVQRTEDQRTPPPPHSLMECAHVGEVVSMPPLLQAIAVQVHVHLSQVRGTVRRRVFELVGGVVQRA
jgi:hypothetical protein